MPLAGVDQDEPPAIQSQRHWVDLERLKVDAQGRVHGAAERCQLIEHPRLGAHPVVLHTRAQAGDVDPVEWLLLADRRARS